MLKWAREKLKKLEKVDICGFIFKSRSPSSGIGGVKVHTPSGMPSRTGAGIFGRAFMRYFPIVPVIDDGRLHDPRLRENFIERVFVYKRCKQILKKSSSIRDLITFHTDHKLLILSHSPRHLNSLGKLVASAKKYTKENLSSEYIKILTEGLQLLATVKKNTNVLLHIAGYFKKRLSPEDKQELHEVIEYYHMGYVPLIVPIILIKDSRPDCEDFHAGVAPEHPDSTRVPRIHGDYRYDRNNATGGEPVVITALHAFLPCSGSVSGPDAGRADMGNGNYRLAKRYGIEAARLATYFTIILGAVFILIPDAIIILITTNKEVTDVARPILRIAGAAQIFYSSGIVLAYALQSAGATVYVMLVEVLTHWIIFLPLCWLLGVVLGGVLPEPGLRFRCTSSRIQC